MEALSIIFAISCQSTLFQKFLNSATMWKNTIRLRLVNGKHEQIVFKSIGKPVLKKVYLFFCMIKKDLPDEILASLSRHVQS